MAATTEESDDRLEMTAREGRKRLFPRRGFVVAAVVLTIVGVALRWPSFGDPFYSLDENFYLFAGDRLLHGELPYVDIWDRKPIGLFLIYAAIRTLGGAGFLEYQLAATCFAIATALVVMRIAARRCGAIGAGTVGLVYMLFLEPLGGGGGQSPVFYNLPVALAMLLTLRAADSADLGRIGRLGMVACLLCGFAIQVKYTAAFEGTFFGLALLGLVRRTGGSGRQLLKWGAAFGLAGLAPTICALGFYLLRGHGDAFLFANFVSIMRRASPGAMESVRRIAIIVAILWPLIAAAGAGLWLRRREDRAGNRWIALMMVGWPLAAASGIAMVGTYYYHYALPLVAPLAALAGPLFDRRRAGPIAALCAALWALTVRDYPGQPAAQTRAEMAGLRRLVEANLHGGCLFIRDGPPSLYYLTGACRVTRFAFPGHLTSAVEANAIGVDPAVEWDHILAARPAVIVAEGRIGDRAAPSYRLVGLGRLRGRDYGVYAVGR